jgi:hypothetical protein
MREMIDAAEKKRSVARKTSEHAAFMAAINTFQSILIGGHMKTSNAKAYCLIVLGGLLLNIHATAAAIVPNPQWVSLNQIKPANFTGVYALAHQKGKLFAGGNFIQIGSAITTGIAQFDGNSWAPVGGGIKSGQIKALAFDTAGILSAGGTFDSIGKTKANNIALWNGQTWLPYGTGSVDPIRTICFTDKNKLYIAGDIHESYPNWAQTDYSISILTWDDTTWNEYLFTYFGAVYNSATYQPYKHSCVRNMVSHYKEGLYYLGVMSRLPSINTRVLYSVEQIAIDKDSNFILAGSKTRIYDTAYFIEKTMWTSSGLKTTSIDIGSYYGSGFKKIAVNAITTDNKGNIFFGGNFNLGNRGVNLAYWDSDSIRPLGKISGTVYSLSIDTIEGRLFVGGEFDSAGHVFSPMVAAVDLYVATSVTTQNKSISSKEIKWFISGNWLIFNNTTTSDLICLYSISGVCLRNTIGNRKISIEGIASQPIVFRVFHEKSIVSSGFVIH